MARVVSTELERAVLAVHDAAAAASSVVERVLVRRGLSLSAGLALWLVVPGAAPPTMTELAMAMRCSPANATHVLDQLAAAGLVRRTAAPADRRRRVVTLTRAGERTRSEVIAAVVDGSPLAQLSIPELTSLLRLLALAESRLAASVR